MQEIDESAEDHTSSIMSRGGHTRQKSMTAADAILNSAIFTDQRSPIVQFLQQNQGMAVAAELISQFQNSSNKSPHTLNTGAHSNRSSHIPASYNATHQRSVAAPSSVVSVDLNTNWLEATSRTQQTQQTNRSSSQQQHLQASEDAHLASTDSFQNMQLACLKLSQLEEKVNLKRSEYKFAMQCIKTNSVMRENTQLQAQNQVLLQKIDSLEGEQQTDQKSIQIMPSQEYLSKSRNQNPTS